MTVVDAFFYLFAAGMLGGSFLALLSRDAVQSVLFLILAFFNAAGFFLLLGAEFLAFVLVIVYVGAVALLFLFIVMTVNTDSSPLKKSKILQGTGLVVGGILLVEIILFFVGHPHMGAALFAKTTTVSNVHAIGRVLYTVYFIPFQMVGVILIVGMVGSILLVWRNESRSKKQKMSVQSSVQAKDRLRLEDVPVGKGVSS